MSIQISGTLRQLFLRQGAAQARVAPKAVRGNNSTAPPDNQEKNLLDSEIADLAHFTFELL